VVMDMAMPGMNGVEAVRLIRQDGYAGGVVVLTGHSGQRVVNEARIAGADGYVLKEQALEQLKEAINAALRRESYLSPELIAIGISPVPLKPRDLVTPREFQIMKRLVAGQSVKSIAFSLSLSPKTVETHRANLMLKLRVNNLADLTRLALREGLTNF